MKDKQEPTDTQKKINQLTRRVTLVEDRVNRLEKERKIYRRDHTR